MSGFEYKLMKKHRKFNEKSDFFYVRIKVEFENAEFVPRNFAIG